MKRNYTAISWCAVVLTLALLARDVVSEKIPCPSRCFCAKEGHEEHETSCPDGGEQRIALKQLKTDKKSIFYCQVNTNAKDYNLLSDVYLDVGTSLEFRLCPLPDEPFTDILQVMYNFAI